MSRFDQGESGRDIKESTIVLLQMQKLEADQKRDSRSSELAVGALKSGWYSTDALAAAGTGPPISNPG